MDIVMRGLDPTSTRRERPRGLTAAGEAKTVHETSRRRARFVARSEEGHVREASRLALRVAVLLLFYYVL